VVVVVVVVVVAVMVAVTEVEVAVVLAVAMAAVQPEVTADQITPAALAVTGAAKGSAVTMLARLFAIMAKAETTTAVIAMVIAVMAQRLQASLTPKTLAAYLKPGLWRLRRQVITTRRA